MKKLLSLVLVFLLSVTGVIAATSTDYRIDYVKANDMVAENLNGNAIYAERGQPLDLTVFISGVNNKQNVKVKAWVEGYEYEDVEDTSSMFDLTTNVSRSVPLTLNLPEDMDASKEYTLYVRVSDAVNELEIPYKLRVEETRHKLNIKDVLFRPSSTVESGRFLRTVVRLENLGDRKEEDIKVTVSIPQLGVSTADYVDELVTSENDESDEETSQSTNELVLQLPENAETGDYEVKVTAEYSRGHEIVTKQEMIHVEGKKVLADAEAIISMDVSAKELTQGQEAVYKITFASLAKQSAIYSAEVAGTEGWATAKVEPGFVTLESGKAGEIFVKVTPNKDAVVGAHMFTVKIKDGNTLIKEATLNTEVVRSGIDWSATKSVLEYGFGILVVILVILGLIIAFRRKPSESSDETGTEESYY